MTASLIEQGKKRENTIDFSRFGRQLRRHWWKALLVSLIITGVAAPAILGMTPQYLSTTTVLLKELPTSASPIAPVVRYDSYQGEYYATQNKLVGSRRVITQAVLALGLQNDPGFNGEVAPKVGLIGKLKQKFLHTPPPVVPQYSEQDRIDHAVRIVSANLTVSAVRLTQLVHITYSSPSAAMAAKVANAVGQAFVNLSAQTDIAATKKAYDWNKVQMQKLHDKVEVLKAQMQNLIEKEGLVPYNGVGDQSGIGGFNTEKLGVLFDKLSAARDLAMTAYANYQAMKALEGKPFSSLLDLPQIASNPQLHNLRLNMIKAQSQLVELQKQFGPQYVTVLQAKAQIQVIERHWNQVLGNLEQSLYQQYKEALTKQQMYQQLVDEQQAASQQVGQKTDEYNVLKTDLNSTQQLYQTLYLKTQQLMVNSTYKESNAEVYDAAIPALRPSKPNKPLFIIMVFALSFIFGVVYVIVREALNTKIEELYQVEPRLGVPALGELCQFEIQGDRLTWLESIRHHAPLADTVYGIRSELLAKVETCRVFGVASAEEGEGASTVATLMAMAFGQDQKTLLVDLDTSKNQGGLSFDLKAKKKQGFGEVMEGLASLQESVIPLMSRLDFLPKGQFEQSPLLLFSQSEWAETVKSWLTVYDRILIDLPAVNDSKAPQMVASQLDGLLFVTQSQKEDSPVLVKAIDKLEDHKVKVFGAILNRVPEGFLSTEENRALARDFNRDTLTPEHSA